jgi:hypothetical protein
MERTGCARRLSSSLDGQESVNPRLFVLLARAANVGVVFRRGPSKQVLLLKWDLERDHFEVGQWLKGRIYERRCDLSPSGDRLVYFAATYRGPYQTWTAVSRPPYFTALALWPKGDAWGGGGLFSRENELLLNHPPEQMTLADGFSIPRSFKVGALPTEGQGEDSPIFEEHLRRDGWEVLQRGTWVTQDRLAHVWVRCDPPEVWSKPHPLGSVDCQLLQRCEGLHEKNGSWYMTSYQLKGRHPSESRDLGRADWADWSQDGHLLFAREGKIFRIAMASATRFDVTAPLCELADLSALTFVRRTTPQEAKGWSGKAPVGLSLVAAVQKGVAGGRGPRLRSDPRR